jgi:hypothetical protein
MLSRVAIADSRNPSIRLMEGFVGCLASLTAARVNELVVTNKPLAVVLKAPLKLFKSGLPTACRHLFT